MRLLYVVTFGVATIMGLLTHRYVQSLRQEMSKQLLELEEKLHSESRAREEANIHLSTRTLSVRDPIRTCLLVLCADGSDGSLKTDTSEPHPLSPNFNGTQSSLLSSRLSLPHVVLSRNVSTLFSDLAASDARAAATLLSLQAAMTEAAAQQRETDEDLRRIVRASLCLCW
jgi:hypothetical protein